MRTFACIVLAALLLPFASVRAGANIADFANVTAGHYQVLAQGGVEIGGQINGFMNEMLRHYSRYFSNWTVKDGARVVVFNNLDDFRAYSRSATGITHMNLAGYCHLVTDEAGNTFYELVTYEHERLWQVLAHEGFHQFIGYELGSEIPIWLNEGMAQYFENSTVQKGRLVANIDRTKLALAQRIIVAGRLPPVGDLLAMDRTTFYATPEIDYPISWALVYYLMNRDGAGYSTGQFKRFLQDLKYNRDSVDSFRRHFVRDSDQWQTDFAKYILALRPTAEK